LCNRARFDESDALKEISVGLEKDPLERPEKQDTRRIVGDASDTALFRFCHAIQVFHASFVAHSHVFLLY